MGKEFKKMRKATPLCLFWIIWRERNRVAFDNKVFFAYRLKSSFICNFWPWSNVYSGDRDRSLLDFLTWIGYRRLLGMEGFLEPLAPFFWLFLLSILLVYSEAAFDVLQYCKIRN